MTISSLSSSIPTACPVLSFSGWLTPAPLGNLEAYLGFVKNMPVLSGEEEKKLACRWRENEDLNAAKQLVVSQLRHVVSIARAYKGYGLPLADLIQEGNIGLMKAVKKFDPSVGVKLISFAVHWIKAEIHEFILRNWRMVKIATTKAQRRLFFKLKSFKQKFGQNMELIAKEMNIRKSIVEQMDARLNYNDANIEEIYNMADHHADPAMLVENHDARLQKEKLLNALDNLDQRSKHILHERFLSEKKMTLSELAHTYQVSLERIRQVEKSALEKLKLVLA